MLVPRDDKLHLSSHRLQQLDSIIVRHPLQRMAIDGDNLVIAFQSSIPWEEGEEGERGLREQKWQRCKLLLASICIKLESRG